MDEKEVFPFLRGAGDDSDASSGGRAIGEEVYDTDGNVATDRTLVGDIDGRETTLGALRDYVAQDAAYYITRDAAGNAFETYAQLAAATTYYSGGEVRIPTRNDYCVVLTDETHGGAEWRYVYAVAEGETSGVWQPQYPIDTVVPSDAAPVIAGTANAGSLDSYSRGDHVHPAETKVVAYRLPDNCFPITYEDSTLPSDQQNRTITSNDGIRFEFNSTSNIVTLHDIASEAAGGYEYGFSSFSASTLKWSQKDAPIENLKFNNTASTENTWPVLEKDTVFVRGVQVANEADVAGLAPLASPAFTGMPTAPDPSLDSPSSQIANLKYVNELVDTESPLVARSFTAAPSGTEGDGNGSVIFFKPSYLGMASGDRFKEFIVQTRSDASQSSSKPAVYARLRRFSDKAVLAHSNKVAWPGAPNIEVCFTFAASVVLPNADNVYYIDFVTEPDDNPSSDYSSLLMGLGLYNYGANNDGLYFQRKNLVPKITVHYYSWASDLVTTSRTVNGQPLSSDVMLDASDVDALSLTNGGTVNADVTVVGSVTSNSAVIKGANDETATITKAGITVSGTQETVSLFPAEGIDAADEPNVLARKQDITWANLPDKPPIPAAQVQSDWDESDSDADSFILNKPDFDAKLDSTAAAPEFDATKPYVVGDYVTYYGGLYVCKEAHPAGAWNPTHFDLTDMTTPDATLDVTSQGALRVVSADGTILWQQGYNLKTTSLTDDDSDATNGITIDLSNEAVNYYAFAKDYTGEVTIALPARTTGKVSDFILDVSNAATATAFSATTDYAVNDRVLYGGAIYYCSTAHSAGAWNSSDFTLVYSAFSSAATSYAVGALVVYNNKLWKCTVALDKSGDPAWDGSWTGEANWETAHFTLDMTNNSFVVADGDNLDDMTSITVGELSEFYFTLTAFQLGSNPTYKVVKQVVVDATEVAA